MKLAALIFFLFFFTSNLSAKKIFNAKSFELRNGLKVIVIENNRAPVIAQMIWYNFGSGVENNGKSGLAHFMEHLMFKERVFTESYSDYFKIGGKHCQL